MEFIELNPNTLTAEIQKKAEKLFAQLTEARRPKPLDELFTPSNSISLIGCFVNGTLAGMASLATYTVPSGKKGWIEDVVVDQEQRGRGIGRQLVERLVDMAGEQGCTDLLLFTGYQRKPAITLYESIGFHRKDSHLYYMNLT